MTIYEIIKNFRNVVKQNKPIMLGQMFLEDVLDIINRQKAEIERLKGSVITNNIMETQRIKREAKSEAIKGFADRLKGTITNAINTYYNSNAGGYYLAEDAIEDIDNLIKEMTEVQGNDNI